MEHFDNIYNRACERKGDEQALRFLLTSALPDSQIAKLDDSRILSAFTKKIFQSGFVWRVVENKWAEFERLFFNFEIDKVLMMPDELLEKRAQDPAIIRNAKKVMTIRANALMIHDIQIEKQQSFAQWLAEYPSSEIIQLWLYLKKHGQRLGGNTGPYALRALGKDTFLLTQDIEAYFRSQKLIEGGLTSLRNLNIIQNCFNQWQQESGLSLQTLSQLIAYGVGDNWVGMQGEPE
ncbi:DNA-3-methyladenine glycosylase I [Catenovulum sp. 2E275]|uniref:DNA-3-methyladenine glycosylase I n=1 Tax=Catenovulum sp. 2E275 TaxID=2980497 RepID=UPI0021D2838A|nr:DNA-3-methyladenine glycosylase I [Catenovulum sp. 2E275]MCU4675128.1 DNA-3-methyladenine glycosylase I [Catenovulum sp. 2E275]